MIIQLAVSEGGALVICLSMIRLRLIDACTPQSLVDVQRYLRPSKRQRG